MFNKKIQAEVKKLLKFEEPIFRGSNRNLNTEAMEYLFNSSQPKQKKLNVLKDYISDIGAAHFYFGHFSSVHQAKIIELVKGETELIDLILKSVNIKTDFLQLLSPQTKKMFLSILNKNKAFYFFSFKEILKILDSQNCNRILNVLLHDYKGSLGSPDRSQTPLYRMLNHANESELINLYKKIDTKNLKKLVLNTDPNYSNGFLRVFDKVKDDHKVVKRLFKKIDIETLLSALRKEPQLNSVIMRSVLLNIVLAIGDDKAQMQKLILASQKTYHSKELLKLIETKGLGMPERQY